MKARLLILITLAVLLGLVLVFAVVGPDAALASSPSPSASPTTTPTPEYASAELVASAMKARKAAVRARRALSRVRRCFRDDMPVRVYPRPLRGALVGAWEKALRRWSHQRDDWRAKRIAGMKRMKAPGGGGALRWLPMIRWWWRGYSESTCLTLAHISWHECGGAEHRWNHQGSGAYGIWQCLPKPSWVWDAWSQAKHALSLFREAARCYGDPFWPWRNFGCRAFTHAPFAEGCGLR